MSVADASVIYQVPTGTLRRWIHERRIQGQDDPALIGRRGRRMLYPARDLQAAYEAHQSDTTAQRTHPAT